MVFGTAWWRWLAAVALASLMVTILSGVYLVLFFDPAMATVTYRGPVAYLQGVVVTRAYASVLDICFGVRGGLFVRQVHHWSASLFVASMLASLAAAFFTGAFRRPRRAIWLVNVVLLVVGIAEAFTGILLLDDGMSGTSMRVISGYLLSIPVVGTRLHWALFGGEFPGTVVIPRLYLAHLLLPAAIVALVGARAALLRRYGHPQPGPGRGRRTVVGIRRGPGYAARATAVFAITASVLAVVSGLFQVNPIWLYGPARPANVSAGSTAPWYLGWVDGAVRLWPALDIHLGRHTIPAAFWPSMVFLPASFALLALYPWVERRVARDDAPHRALQRPRDAPRRTAFGVGAAAFYGCLQLAGGIDVIAATFHLSIDMLYWTLRIGVLAVPPLAGMAAYRLCLGLRQRDQEVSEHGVETGIVRRLPDGGYVETRQPVLAADQPPAWQERAL
jgi:ubiquinol-cytochrome c reductase cytochrome b subunit